MSKELDSEIRQKAHKLARKITAAHNLDPEIQEELYGNIEDKLLAYLDGEESVTPEDALILAREHFGNTEILSSLLQEVHMESVQVSLARKMSALLIATLGLEVVQMTIRNILVGLAGSFVADGTRFGQLLVWDLPNFLVLVIGVTGFLLLLRRWKRAEGGDARPWYTHWSVGRMVALLAALLVLRHLIPVIVYPWQLHTASLSAWNTWIMSTLIWASTIVIYIVWFWWSDAVARPVRQMIAIACVWVAFHMTHFVLVTVLISLGSGSLPDQYVAFAEGRLGTLEVAVHYAYYGFGSAAHGSVLLLEIFSLWAAIFTPILWGAHRLRTARINSDKTSLLT